MFGWIAFWAWVRWCQSLPERKPRPWQPGYQVPKPFYVIKAERIAIDQEVEAMHRRMRAVNERKAAQAAIEWRKSRQRFVAEYLTCPYPRTTH